jgi:hypothetical protein
VIKEKPLVVEEKTDEKEEAPPTEPLEGEEYIVGAIEEGELLESKIKEV